jgi:soluble lytic murein transglycosylase-like protein
MRWSVRLSLVLLVATMDVSANEASLYRRVARDYRLPPTVLYATALTASGRTDPTGRITPWPWTLAIDGKRMVYPTREMAEHALGQSQRLGKTVRIGLTGVSWPYRIKAAPRARALLDPDTNLRVTAARIAPALVTRSSDVAWSIAPARLDRLISSEAQRQGLDLSLVRAVIAEESAFNPHALSHKGAMGLMQLMPVTAQRFGINDPWPPEQNLRGGLRYLRWLLNTYRGDVPRTVAAYNAGEGTVDHYGDVPPYPETQRFVARILARLEHDKTARPLQLAEHQP